MARKKLKSLTVRFHEPDTLLIHGAIENQKWQLENLRDSRPYTRSTRMRGLTNEIKRKEDVIEELEKERNMLKKWRITLDPYVDPLELISLYNYKKILIPADIFQWSKKFNFFELNFGGDLFVEKGMSVKKLEIAIVFDPDLKKNQRHAVAYSIFPKNEWKKYGEFSVAFGLNAALGFDVPLTVNGLPIAQIGKVGPTIKSNFLLGPFVYNFKKATVRGVGKGNYIINWIIEKGTILKSGDFETKLVLKVPKNRKTLTARVVLQATVIMPGILPHIFSKKTPLAPEKQTYTIELF